MLRYLKASDEWMTRVDCHADIPVKQWGTSIQVHAFSDADWGGCASTRRSRSGTGVWLNGCLVTHSSKRQKAVSLSSCESEFYALSQTVCEAINVREIVNELCDCDAKVFVYTDSTAAKALASKGGVGRNKHLQTRSLWVQERVQEDGVTLCKVATLANPADLLTKIVCPATQKRLRPAFGLP